VRRQCGDNTFELRAKQGPERGLRPGDVVKLRLSSVGRVMTLEGVIGNQKSRVRVGNRMSFSWRSITVASAGLLAVAAIAAWLLSAPRPVFPANSDALAETGDVQRGKLVFAAGDCSSCHASPGQSDPLRLGGGLALASPYGTFRVPNISPDRVDGIGGWTSVDLANAMLSGVSPDGKHYYPAFPYTSFGRMNVTDIPDLMAYLRSLPAVSGRPPPHELALPFRIRRVLGLWKLLYFDRSPIPDDPSRDPAWNRGRYLVEAAAHCAECHSTRNVFGAIKPATRYAGAVDPENVGYIPNITPGAIAHWSVDDIVRMLTSGDTPNHGRVGSSMTGVVMNTAQLSDADRLGIAIYIKSLPALPTSQP
jgi:mono/diheme cytochrome c family protein